MLGCISFKISHDNVSFDEGFSFLMFLSVLGFFHNLLTTTSVSDCSQETLVEKSLFTHFPTTYL